MKKILILSSLIGLSALLSSCMVDRYGNVIPAGGVYAGGPGYYGPYGDPFFVYGGLSYYNYNGRYCYYNHGRRIFVNRLPSGGHYYRASSGVHFNNHYNASYNNHVTTGGPAYRTLSHTSGNTTAYGNHTNQFTGHGHQFNGGQVSGRSISGVAPTGKGVQSTTGTKTKGKDKTNY